MFGLTLSDAVNLCIFPIAFLSLLISWVTLGKSCNFSEPLFHQGYRNKKKL